MKKLLTLIFALFSTLVYSQNYRLKAGDHFPDLIFRPMVNAPVKELDLNHYPGNKLYILNNWGTWCAPCMPEMEMLAKLQDKYPTQIQIIGVSNDSPEKLRKFIAKRPSKIWLASDTSEMLYQMLDLASVGYSAIVDARRNIVAVVNTDSLSTKMIDRLLKGEKVVSDAKIKERLDNSTKDAFGVDTTMTSSFTIRGYMKGQQSLGRVPTMGAYAKRRISYYNVGFITLYRTAYEIRSPKQIIYEIDKKKYNDYNDQSQLYCFDLLVSAAQKDSLYPMMQRKLQGNLPVKARTEMRTMPVYLLKTKPGAPLTLPLSAPNTRTYSFNGNGFDGKEITLAEFAHIYLSNELELPVIDETGLTKGYDIKTSNDARDKTNIFAAVDKLGLTLEKAERPVKVIVLYE
ncbi:TIGR03435 family protein [Mucilaginibacter galii]|uniref:Thioredoxin domain-containing protein n=1 Tax=Mucilaginibacter galii TaxID=2005073 RepID=A0A917J958_9SPHI|nr:TIGR03435 family protein [Mucilaginibacter galii]GGI50934.1 hypothetical protein GCM10011425_21460 [Mucilaginibacter galii]